MKYKGKSMMSLNQMVEIGIKYQGDGYVTGYPIVSGNDAYILNGVIEANSEYIAIEQWVPVFPESLQLQPSSLPQTGGLEMNDRHRRIARLKKEQELSKVRKIRIGINALTEIFEFFSLALKKTAQAFQEIIKAYSVNKES